MLLIAEEGAGSSAVILTKASNQIWDLREERDLYYLLPNMMVHIIAGGLQQQLTWLVVFTHQAVKRVEIIGTFSITTFTVLLSFNISCYPLPQSSRIKL